MASEKRKHPRFKIDQMVEMSFLKEKFHKASAVDLSAGGLRLMCDSPVEPSSCIYIMMSLEISGKTENIHFEGAASWVKKNGKHYEIGIEITDITDDNEEKIKRFLSNK